MLDMFVKNIFCLLISLSVAFCTENPLNIVPEDNTKSGITHHLKWITNQTLYPIKFSIPINYHEFNDSTVWDWIRTSDQNYVSKLPDILENYLVTETESRSSMYILKYDNITHNQLSSYEPRFITDEPNFVQKERDIFTMAYLKKHYIKAQKTDESIKVSCVADFLIPNADSEYSDVILRLMEKHASFKLSVKSANFPNKPNFFRKQNINPPFSRKPSRQPPSSVRPQPTPDQPFFYPNTNSHPPNSPPMNQNPPVYHQPNQHFPEYHQFEQDQFFQQNVIPQQEPFDPFHSFPIYNHVDQYGRNEFAGDQHFFDTMHYYDDLVEHSKPGVGYTQFRFEPPRSRGFYYPYDRFDYDDIFYRFRRESNKNLERSEPTEEDFDYDPVRFSKVRLSLGPVIINKPFEKEEVVSCLLNLINYDDVNLAYNSRIIKKIKTSDEKKVPKVEKPIPNIEKESLEKESLEKESLEKESLEKELDDLEVIEPVTKSTVTVKQTTESTKIISSTLPSDKLKQKTHTRMMILTDRTTFDPKLAKFEHYFSNGSNNQISSLLISMIFFTIANILY